MAKQKDSRPEPPPPPPPDEDDDDRDDDQGDEDEPDGRGGDAAPPPQPPAAGGGVGAPEPKRFLRGARPSPRHRLLGAEPFRRRMGFPQQFAYVPKHLTALGNDQYGDCVSAEEGFAKQCHAPQIDVGDKVVIDWARRHGYLNGADLVSVMDDMQHDGFKVGPQQYNDGGYKGVDYSQDAILRGAISVGPVKIAIDANALPSGAGNKQGWYAVGRGRFPNTDHCVALCGYGPAGWLYEQLGVPLPPGLKPDQPGYLLYTWATIGYVDHDWLQGTCTEAWVRDPTTVGVPPLPEPTPTPTPPPPPTPTPTPGAGWHFDLPDATGRVLHVHIDSSDTPSGGANMTRQNDQGEQQQPRERPAGEQARPGQQAGKVDWLATLRELLALLLKLFPTAGGRKEYDGPALTPDQATRVGESAAALLRELRGADGGK